MSRRWDFILFISTLGPFMYNALGLEKVHYLQWLSNMDARLGVAKAHRVQLGTVDVFFNVAFCYYSEKHMLCIIYFRVQTYCFWRSIWEASTSSLKLSTVPATVNLYNASPLKLVPQFHSIYVVL